MEALTLCELQVGEALTVEAVGGDAAMKRRLEDLGVVPETQILCWLESPLGDPRAYRIRGAVIALRKADAMHIRGRRSYFAQTQNGDAYGIDQTLGRT